MADLQSILSLTRTYNTVDSLNMCTWSKSGSTRFAIANDGELQLPNATAAGQGILLGGDVEFYRAAANILGLDDTLQIANGLGIRTVALDGATLLIQAQNTAAQTQTVLTVQGAATVANSYITAQAGGTWTAVGTWTLPALTLGGAIAGGAQNITGLGTIAGVSLATSAATPLLLTNGQLVNIALTSQTVGATTLTIPDFASVVDEFTFKTKAQTMANKTLTAPVINGTVTTTGLTLPATTLGASLTAAAALAIVRAATNGDITITAGTSYHDGASITLYGSTGGVPGLLKLVTPDAAQAGYGVTRIQITGVIDTAVATCTSLTWTGFVATNSIALGVAGSALGTLNINGNTSGTVSLTVAAAAGTWTMTLPAAANTNAGYQLTCAGADSITSWAAAASKLESKDLIGLASPQDSLNLILNTKAYRFHYKPGMGTGDVKTEYVGFVAEERPEFTHYNQGVLNPVNTFGHTVGAIQALHNRIEELEKQVIILSGR